MINKPTLEAIERMALRLSHSDEPEEISVSMMLYALCGAIKSGHEAILANKISDFVKDVLRPAAFQARDDDKTQLK